MNIGKIILSIFVVSIVSSCISQSVVAQTEKLGIVQYKPPKGWTKSEKENVVVFSTLNQTTGEYCFITLHGATPGTGKPEKDFSREWDKLVVKPFGAEANPTKQTAAAEGWTAISGGAGVEFQGSKAAAFLTVFSRGETTISVLGIFNDESYSTQLIAFVEAIKPDKVVADNPVTEREGSSPTAPAVSTTMHAAALVREFENNEIRANGTYVGKRVRITGTVNNIEIDKAGNIVLTFKSSVATYRMAQCYFGKSQSSRVGALNAHEQATVEGTVKGLGGGFDNSKAFLVLEDCTVP